MSKNQTLVILDLKQEYDISREDIDIVNLSYGNIKLKNYSLIKIKNIEKKKIDETKKEILFFLKKYFKIFNNSQKLFNSNELEISNQRNDKSNLFDKLINLIILKKYIFKKYKNIEIIFDDKIFCNSYYSLKNTNIKINNLSKNKNEKVGILYFILKRFFFFIRSFILILFIKIFTKNNYLKSKEFNFSIMPIFENKNIYLNKNLPMINFSITDETHLNLKLFQKMNLIKRISKKPNFIISEKYIELISIIKNFILSFYFIKIIYHYKNKQYFLNKIQVDEIFYNLFVLSILNRLKLTIYDKAIYKFIKETNLKKINFYLFEYNFGFYLRNQIKKNFKNIYLTGYQHGIFSKNLFWLDNLKYNNALQNYLPEKIISSNKLSYDDYKNLLSSKFKININNSFYKNNLKLKKIRKNKNNKVLIILGQHDINDLVYFFKFSNKYKPYKKYFKPHPRSDINNLKKFNLNVVNKIDINKYEKIFISQTSTLIYEFEKNKLKYNLIELDYKLNIINNSLMNKIKN